MKINDWIKNKILTSTGIQELTGNPNREHYTMFGSQDEINQMRLREYFVWYRGDSDEILDFFTGADFSDFNKSPIYNRNKKDYFWVIAGQEKNIKRTHSGVPRAIIDTLVNAVGEPHTEVSNEQANEWLDDIIEENDMANIINQEQMPYTLIGGWGAFKIDVDTQVSQNPIISFYTADNVDFIYHKKRLLGVIFREFFERENKKYVLFETRSSAKGDSYITYDLFRIGKNDELYETEKSLFADLGDLEDKVIRGLNKPLAVPSVFFEEVDKKGFGRSIYTGKVDLFDDLDQCVSQSSNTVRKSTPIEYYPADMLERSANGKVRMPERYDRTFIPSPIAAMTGDGQQSGELKTTQPILNFAQYGEEEQHITSLILSGILSPATMGIDIAKKDNAEAQREKEKVTLMTRNNIVARQIKILRDVYEMALIMKSYIMNPDMADIPEFDISLSYKEFANPSFESKLSVLGPALSNGNISPKKYVELLWGDALSEKEKQEEIEYLESQLTKDDLEEGAFDLNDETEYSEFNEREKEGESDINAIETNLSSDNL